MPVAETYEAESQVTHITIDYSPRPEQWELHQLMDSYRFGVAVCHRRMGKTFCALHELNKRAVCTESDNWRGSYIAPTYAMAKAISWEYLKSITSIVPGIRTNESELRVDYPNGARIRLFGGDKPESLRGLYHDTVFLDEYDSMKPELWTQIIRPAIADRQGSAFFIGTYVYTDGPLGQLYDYGATDRTWFTRVWKASDTDALTEDELRDARRIMDPEEYAREFECARASAVRGSIYGRHIDAAESEGRITQVPHDPTAPVITAWDLGLGDAMAVWCVQLVGKEVRLIDYLIDDTGDGLEGVVKQLQSKNYNYREHIAPHDMQIRDIGTGRTRVETAMRLGLTFRVLPRISQQLRNEDDERIHAGRGLFPRCYFDAVNCKKGIDALRSYRRTKNATTGEFNAKPLHDWASHGADAFGYLALGVREQQQKARPRPQTKWIR